MKKTLLIMVMALAVLLTQCRKPEVKFPSPVAPEGTTVSMTVTAGPGSKTDITPAGGITWSTGDKLYVGYDSKYVGCLTIVSGQNTPTGTFTGDVMLPTGTENGEKTFHFFYLGNAARTLAVGETSAVVDFSSQNIYKNGDKLENASAQHVGYGSAKGTVKDGVVTGINVTLVSKVALAHFSFKKNSTDYTGELTLNGDKIYSSMTVGFGGTFTHGATAGSISLTGSHAERHVMLVPTGDATAQTLTFTGSAEDGTGDVPGLQANKFYGKTDAIAVTLTATTIHVTSVSLNKTSLSLAAGATETLVPTVSPDNATNKSVTWSSSAAGVATVSDAGLVTAVAAGTATITVTTVDGNKTATCEVTVTAPTPASVFTVNKDNGTTVTFAPGNLYYDKSESKWKFESNQWDFRTYNDGTKEGGSCIGGVYNASSGTPSGDWGLFGWSGGTGSATYGKSTSTNDSDYSGTFKDWSGITDLPPAGEGKTWRTLTNDEWKNLLGISSGTSLRDDAEKLRAWVTLKITETVSVPGLVILPDGSEVKASSVTTKALVESSGAVFLPAAGRRNGTNVGSVGSSGYYWSSTQSGSNNAYCMYFLSTGGVYASTNDRCYGMPVRLVR